MVTLPNKYTRYCNYNIIVLCLAYVYFVTIFRRLSAWFVYPPNTWLTGDSLKKQMSISIRFSPLRFGSVFSSVHSDVDQYPVQSTQMSISIRFSPVRCRSVSGSVHSDVDQYPVQSTQMSIIIRFSPVRCRSVFSSVQSGVDQYSVQSSQMSISIRFSPLRCLSVFNLYYFVFI